MIFFRFFKIKDLFKNSFQQQTDLIHRYMLLALKRTKESHPLSDSINIQGQINLKAY